MKRMIWKKKGRLVSMFVMICLVLGLMPNVTPEASAEQLTGLCATDVFEYDQDGIPETVASDAEYLKGVTMYMSNSYLHLKYISGDTQQVLKAADIAVYDAKDNKVGSETVYIEDHSSGSEDFVMFAFYKTGEFHIKSTVAPEDDIIVFVEYPRVGFYTSAKKEDTSFLAEDSYDPTQNDTIYLITSPQTDETVTLPDVAEGEETYDTYRFAIEDLNRSFIKDAKEVEGYMTYEKVSDQVYKIKLNKELAQRGFWLLTMVEVSNGQDSWIEQKSIQIQCENAADEKLQGSTNVIWDDETGDIIGIEGGSYRDSIEIAMPWKRHISIQYLDPDGNAYAMFIDHLHVTDAWGNETSDISLTEEYGGYITILPKKAGIYRLYYKVSDEREASMFLRVATPSVEIFRTQKARPADLAAKDCEYVYRYGKTDRDFYLVSTDDNIKISDVAIKSVVTKEDEVDVTTRAAVTVDTKTEGKVYCLHVPDGISEDLYVNLSYTCDYGENYTEEWDTQIEILPKETFDVSTVKWDYTAPFTYDGTTKKVELTGLPEGLSATYTNNEATEPGDYTAQATFVYDDTEYDVPEFTATGLEWKIQPKLHTDEPEATPTPTADNTQSTQAPVPTADNAQSTPAPVPPANNPQGTTAPTQTPDVSKNAKEKEQVKVGTVKQIGKSKYKVLSASNGKYTVALVGYTDKKATKITIPAAVTINKKSYKVTEIGVNVCKGFKKLKQVTIAKNVTTIGKNAFFNCKKLKKVTIQTQKLKKVGKNAFKNTAKKCKVTVPKKKAAAYKKMLKKAGIK